MAVSQPTEQTACFEGLGFDNVPKCIHCGLCLETCPTYKVAGTEQDSPRGRLYLMRGLWEGDIAADGETTAPLWRCIGCRACETACPSGVPYGELIEKSRAALTAGRGGPWPGGPPGRWFFRSVLVDGGRLRRMAALLRRLQRAGRRGFSRLPVPRTLRRALALMPRFDGESFKQRVGSGIIAPAPGRPPRGRVAFFSGCILDVAEGDIHRSTLVLLLAAGYEVMVPAGQVCCGALHVHHGDRQTARTLARANLKTFAGDRDLALVVNSAGCSAHLKELKHLFSAAEAEEAAAAGALRGRVADALELLHGTPGFPSTLAWRTEEVGVLYDAPCHALHAQGIDAQPRALLSALPGVALIPLADADTCCGAGGIYNLNQADLAERILDRKLNHIEASLADHPEARILLTANPGCLLQLRYGIEKRGLPLQVLHPLVFMAQRLAPGQCSDPLPIP